MINDPVPPLAAPALLSDDGTVWVPDVFVPACFRELPLCEGLAIGWAPISDTGKALAILFGGNPDAPTGEAIATALTPEGLRAAGDCLHSIADQMDAT